MVLRAGCSFHIVGTGSFESDIGKASHTFVMKLLCKLTLTLTIKRVYVTKIIISSKRPTIHFVCTRQNHVKTALLCSNTTSQDLNEPKKTIQQHHTTRKSSKFLLRTKRKKYDETLVCLN